MRNNAIYFYFSLQILKFENSEARSSSVSDETPHSSWEHKRERQAGVLSGNETAVVRDKIKQSVRSISSRPTYNLFCKQGVWSFPVSLVYILLLDGW